MSSNRYRIGEYQVDLDTGTLVSRDKEVHLPALSRKILSCLISKAPQIVSQNELIETVWEGVSVTDENLQQRIKLVRKVLGDDSKNPQYIETIRGIGYQIIADLHPIDELDLSRGTKLKHSKQPVRTSLHSTHFFSAIQTKSIVIYSSITILLLLSFGIAYQQ